MSDDFEENSFCLEEFNETPETPETSETKKVAESKEIEKEEKAALSSLEEGISSAETYPNLLDPIAPEETEINNFGTSGFENNFTSAAVSQDNFEVFEGAAAVKKDGILDEAVAKKIQDAFATKPLIPAVDEIVIPSETESVEDKFEDNLIEQSEGLMTTNAEFDREAEDGARSSLLQNGQTNVTPRIEIADKNDNPLEGSSRAQRVNELPGHASAAAVTVAASGTASMTGSGTLVAGTRDVDEAGHAGGAAIAGSAAGSGSAGVNLGSRMNSRESPDPTGDTFETMSIPGVPRVIPELDQAVVGSLQEVMGEEDKANLLGDELATKLSEPNPQLMIAFVQVLGVDVALDLFYKTKDIELKGGMMIKNGERRRTPGEVLMKLLRDAENSGTIGGMTGLKAENDETSGGSSSSGVDASSSSESDPENRFGATNQEQAIINDQLRKQLRKPIRHIRMTSATESTSFTSTSVNEDESTYGGSQFRTSSQRAIIQVPENHTVSGGKGDFDDRIDVGLTVRLQHQLKRTELAKNKLEKRLEQIEMRGLKHLEAFGGLLTCCVCLDRTKNPKMLPCLHWLCMEPCLDGVADYAKRQVTCPNCRAEHPLPYNGIQDFLTNYTLGKFLELHAELEATLQGKLDKTGKKPERKS